MNVFLPYSDYQKSIECLDKKRCMKQALEAKQLIDGLLGLGSLTWTRHPASRMFRDNINSLIKYYNLCLEHSIKHHKINFVKLKYIPSLPNLTDQDPVWLGYEPFHSRMRARLLHKDSHYQKFGWTEEPVNEKEGYIWPVDKSFSLIGEIREFQRNRNKPEMGNVL